jgi:hypothetical protein
LNGTDSGLFKDGGVINVDIKSGESVNIIGSFFVFLCSHKCMCFFFLGCEFFNCSTDLGNGGAISCIMESESAFSLSQVNKKY